MKADEKFHVYMAGPLYGSGTTGENIRRMVKLSHQVRCVGLVPFLPHLYYFQDLILPCDREYWLGLDLDWVRRCDAFVQLTGPSPGADLERKLAVELNLPVVEIHPSNGPDEREDMLTTLRKYLEVMAKGVES